MEKYLLYLNECKQKHLSLSQKLAASERSDEAKHERIKANIYDICLTTYSALKKAGRESEYKNRLNSFRSAWKNALELAKAHNMTEKAMIEEMKLLALSDAEKQFYLTEEKG